MRGERGRRAAAGRSVAVVTGMVAGVLAGSAATAAGAQVGARPTVPAGPAVAGARLRLRDALAIAARRQPALAIAFVGGLAVATLLTRVVILNLYLLAHAGRERLAAEGA